MKKYKISFHLKKASDLTKEKTTASGICNDFSKGNYSIYYHSYKPENSFVAVPPEWLKEIALKAGENDIADELNRRLEEAKGAKDKIRMLLREKANNRKSK